MAQKTQPVCLLTGHTGWVHERILLRACMNQANTLGGLMSVVEVRSLAKPFRGGVLGKRQKVAPRDVNLTVLAGMIHGILRPNGAGKKGFSFGIPSGSC
ncbi:MAG: hypothetical protein ACE5G5_12545 [Candidatus Methylomirabilales bacterium]